MVEHRGGLGEAFLMNEQRTNFRNRSQGTSAWEKQHRWASVMSASVCRRWSSFQGGSRVLRTVPPNLAVCYGGQGSRWMGASKSEGHIPRQGLVSLGPIPLDLHGGPNLMTICWQSYPLYQSRCNTGRRQRHSINIWYNNDWSFK